MIPLTAGQQRARRTDARSAPRIVWVTAPGDDESVEGVECVDLPTAVRRAADAVPRTSSLMLPTSAIDQLTSGAGIGSLGRAHRIVLCEDGPRLPVAPGVARSRIGVLPRPFDVEAFAGALAWLATRHAG